MSKIPFVDLGAHHRKFAAAFKKAFNTTLGNSQFILGGEIEAFEREFAKYVGVKHVVGVSNGTDALRLALEGSGMEPGGEVIVPAYTFAATALAVSHAGGVPRFVDVSDDSATLDPAKIEAAITPKTRAIMPVHLWGHPADMDAILEIARRRGLKVIEDAAQAHGATVQGRRVGSIGDAAAFSFYPSKNLGALGDAGALATNDDALADRVRRLRNVGQGKKYHHVDLGYNNRLDTLQAAFLRIKLKKLDAHNRMRRKNAELYDRLLAPLGVRTPPAHAGHVYHLYTIRHPKRDAIAKALTDAGIACGIYYPIPLHLQECYARLGGKKGDHPVSERLAGEVLSLPMYPELGAAQIKRVAAAVRLAL